MSTKILMLCAILSLAGCASVDPAACRVIEIANDEGDFAAAWYTSAGDVLERCGIKGSKEAAVEKSCAAQKRSGYEC